MDHSFQKLLTEGYRYSRVPTKANCAKHIGFARKTANILFKKDNILQNSY